MLWRYFWLSYSHVRPKNGLAFSVAVSVLFMKRWQTSAGLLSLFLLVHGRFACVTSALWYSWNKVKNSYLERACEAIQKKNWLLQTACRCDFWGQSHIWLDGEPSPWYFGVCTIMIYLCWVPLLQNKCCPEEKGKYQLAGWQWAFCHKPGSASDCWWTGSEASLL